MTVNVIGSQMAWQSAIGGAVHPFFAAPIDLPDTSTPSAVCCSVIPFSWYLQRGEKREGTVPGPFSMLSGIYLVQSGH